MFEQKQRLKTWCRGLSLWLLSIATACAGQKSDCGNNVSAILGSKQRKGAESGLLGGMIRLANGQECYAAFDVLRAFGGSNTQSYHVALWTGHHCEIDVKTIKGEASGFNLPGVTLRIFGDKGYTDVAATHRIKEVLDGHFSALSSASSRLRDALTDDALVPPSELMLASQAVCKDSEVENFCATYSDVRVTEVLLGSVFGSPIPSDLQSILNQAAAKRDESRSLAARSSGLEGETNRMSQSLVDYWRVWHQFSVAPLVDLWRSCLSEESLAAFNKSSGGSDWAAKLLDAGTLSGSAELQDACGGLKDLAVSFSMSPIFGETIAEALQKAELVDGETPRSGKPPRAFTSYLIAKEKQLREDLENQWSGLAKSLFSEGMKDEIYVHTNVVYLGTPGATRGDRSNAQRQWQHAVVPFSAFAGQGAVSPIVSGVKVVGSIENPADFSAAFEKGDSGSVLSFKGHFPILVVSTVNGDYSSGGAAVVPVAGSSVSGSGPDPFASEMSSQGAGSAPSALNDRESAPLPTAKDTPDSAWSGTSVNPTRLETTGQSSGAENCL